MPLPDRVSARFVLLLMLAQLAVAAPLVVHHFARADAISPWLSDVDRAFAEARKSGKPIFAVVVCFH